MENNNPSTERTGLSHEQESPEARFDRVVSTEIGHYESVIKDFDEYIAFERARLGYPQEEGDMPGETKPSLEGLNLDAAKPVEGFWETKRVERHLAQDTRTRDDLLATRSYLEVRQRQEAGGELDDFEKRILRDYGPIARKAISRDLRWQEDSYANLKRRQEENATESGNAYMKHLQERCSDLRFLRNQIPNTLFANTPLNRLYKPQ